MQFRKVTISTTLATLTLAVQGYTATAIPVSTSQASTRYNVILQQIGLKPAQISITQPQTIQSQAAKSQATQSQTIQTKSQKSVLTGQARQASFNHPPTLIWVTSSRLGANIPSGYEFTLTVPQDAGQVLKAVKINQSENVETVKFDASKSRAYIGRRQTANSKIRLASIGSEKTVSSGEATIVFDQPVQLGNTVTIALAVQRNPMWGGVYLFGVTAYPDGENGLGQFLGYGRIHFSGNSN